MRCRIVSALMAACCLVFPALGQEPTQMQYPLAVAAAADGSLYVADRKLPGLWKIADGKPSVFFQADRKFGTPLNAVRCVAVDAQQRIWAGDSGLRDVLLVDGQLQAPQGLTVTDDQKGRIEIPMSVAPAKDGSLLVADLDQHCVWRVPTDGGAPSKLARVAAPVAVAQDSQQSVWVVTRALPQVVRISPSGDVETLVDSRIMDFPSALVLDHQDHAVIVDSYGRCLWKLTAGQAPQKWVEDARWVHPTGVTWLAEDLIVVDPRSAEKLYRVTPEGQVSAVLSGQR